MTNNIGHARVSGSGLIHSYQPCPTLELAQEIVKSQNEHNALFKVPDDRWIVAEVREYQMPRKLYAFEIYRENTDFEQATLEAESPEKALARFFEDFYPDGEETPEPRDHYTAYSHEYEVDKRKG